MTIIAGSNRGPHLMAHHSISMRNVIAKNYVYPHNHTLLPHPNNGAYFNLIVLAIGSPIPFLFEMLHGYIKNIAYLTAPPS